MRRPNERKRRETKQRQTEKKDITLFRRARFTPGCVTLPRRVAPNLSGDLVKFPSRRRRRRANAYGMNYGRRTAIMRKRRGNHPSQVEREGGGPLLLCVYLLICGDDILKVGLDKFILSH